MYFFSPRRTLFLCAVFTALAVTRPAAAHFVWIDIADEGGESTAQVTFGENAEPGEARLLTKISKSRAWARLADGSLADLKLVAPQTEDQPAALVARLPPGVSQVEAACDYGVYTRAPGGVRLQYFARCLASNAAQGVPSNRLKLEIVPALRDGKLEIVVLFSGRPDAEAELVELDDEARGSDVKIDADARAVLKLPKSGKLVLRAKHVAAQESGEIDGQRYAQTWYCATLVLTGLQESSPAEQTAAAALARARDGRAIWRDFPGFMADVVVRSDEAKLDATATIDASGEVKLSGDRSPLHDWTEQQLQSLVQHRMPDGEVAEGNVTFVAEAAEHPLGRLIDLGDAERRSRYRLKDGVIMEVNRLMGPQRFTISVLSIQRNLEQKYLPEAFTMTFWNVKSGELKESLAYWNSWRRVGDFDLPERILEVAAGPQGAKTTELTFHNQRLLEPPASADGVHAR